MPRGGGICATPIQLLARLLRVCFCLAIALLSKSKENRETSIGF